MTFIDRSQPRERDDELPLAPPIVHDDAPPLTDETDSAILAKLSRSTAEGHGQLDEALRLLSEGKHQHYAAAIRRCADLLTDAAALSRRLSKSFTARR